jgi:hypothetical protein
MDTVIARKIMYTCLNKDAFPAQLTLTFAVLLECRSMENVLANLAKYLRMVNVKTAILPSP